MKVQLILSLIYFIVAALFLGVNSEYARGTFHINLIFGKADVAIFPLIIGISFIWMLIIILIDYMSINSLKKQIYKLKAQVHDTEKSEMLKLLKEINEKFDGHATTVYQQLHEIEEMIKGKQNQQKTE